MEILQGSEDKTVIELEFVYLILDKTKYTSNILYSFIGIIYYANQCLIILFSVDLLQYLQDFNEKIDNVQVELNGSQDVFFSTESGHDHLQDGRTVGEMSQ